MKRRRLGAAALALAGVALLVWRVAIMVIEREPTGPASDPPTCTGTLDPAYARRVERARTSVAAMLDERRIPGLAVAVAVGGRIAWSEGVGYADRERGVPACADTQFRIQSVSKPITAAAMARLVESGALDLDAPIRTWVPDLPQPLGAVTPRQLASHRAGVRHYRDDRESLTTTRYDTAYASLERFRNDPLLFTPDTRASYSSYGFVLLSAAMERATGLDFPALLRREVFQPLGMARSEAERAGVTRDGRASFYDHVTPYATDGDVHPSPEIDFSGKWAGGGLLSTVEDLVTFGNAHIKPFNQGFLPDDTLDLLFAMPPRPLRPTALLRPIGQGLGWRVGVDPRLRRVRFHFGAGSGGTAVLAIFPDQQVSLAVLANLGHARFPFPRLLGITNAFVGDPLAPVAWILAVVALAGAVALWRRPGAAPRVRGAVIALGAAAALAPPALAHPGVGIVMDARGNLYYTDLARVWRIAPDGTKSVAVHNVHTHELCLDADGSLYGEHLWYEGEEADRWGHYVWRLRPDGALDKVVGPREGFLTDYSFVRDAPGAMYWVDRERGEIRKRSPDGVVTVLARHPFRQAGWMTATPEGVLYLTDGADLLRVGPDGGISAVARNLSERALTQFHVRDQHNLMGLWTDPGGNVYVAVWGAGVVKRVAPGGAVSVVARSGLFWGPTGGLVAPNGDLWILEASITNRVRVRRIGLSGPH
jgi:CubicO group peptidase (beta-lactamase class C family)